MTHEKSHCYTFCPATTQVSRYQYHILIRLCDIYVVPSATEKISSYDFIYIIIFWQKYHPIAKSIIDCRIKVPYFCQTVVPHLKANKAHQTYVQLFNRTTFNTSSAKPTKMALASIVTDSEPIQHIVLYHLSTPEACSAFIEFMLSLKPRLSKYVLDIQCGTVKPVEPIRNGGWFLSFPLPCPLSFQRPRSSLIPNPVNEPPVWARFGKDALKNTHRMFGNGDERNGS